MAQRPRHAPAPAARAAVAVLHGHHRAAAAEAVVGAAEAHCGEAEQGQRPRAHDARLARHVQRTPGAAARLPAGCTPTALEAAAFMPQAGSGNLRRPAGGLLQSERCNVRLQGVRALCKAGGLNAAAADRQPLVDGLQLRVASRLRQVQALGTSYLRAGRIQHGAVVMQECARCANDWSHCSRAQPPCLLAQ